MVLDLSILHKNGTLLNNSASNISLYCPFLSSLKSYGIPLIFLKYSIATS